MGRCTDLWCVCSTFVFFLGTSAFFVVPFFTFFGRTSEQLSGSQLPVSAAGANADVVLLGRRLVRHRLRVGSAGPRCGERTGYMIRAM